MKRALPLMAVLLVQMVFAPSAAGKGGEFPLEASLVGGVARIRGPGLDHPIVVPWRGHCLTFCNLREDRAPFVRLALGAQVVGFRRYVSHQAPDLDRLGPRYTLRFAFRLRGGRVVRVHLDMYPYGPGDLPPYVTTQPWFRLPPGQVGLSEYGVGKPLDPGWYPGSPLLLDLLNRIGLPPNHVEAAQQPEPGEGEATSVRSLSIALAASALLAALLFLALVVRRRGIRRAERLEKPFNVP